MLKMAGRQAASYLALDRAASALAEARQFEGFNRLSAFVMHDIKNLIAQLSLVMKNAERHKNNPEFIDDAILTIRNSVDKMSSLMAQLRSAIPGKRHDKIALRSLLGQLATERSAHAPVPTFAAETADDVQVFANKDRLAAIVSHVVQNAQEATGAGGRVDIRLKIHDEYAVIEVEDDGVGMDEKFIKTRLFKPFDSTKGLTGMGIGAYECREFVVSLGGRVNVVSRPGEGTQFSIYLPLPLDSTAGENAL
jgi:putative PEP-CTERM system histidine kinase